MTFMEAWGYAILFILGLICFVGVSVGTLVFIVSLPMPFSILAGLGVLSILSALFIQYVADNGF